MGRSQWRGERVKTVEVYEEKTIRERAGSGDWGGWESQQKSGELRKAFYTWRDNFVEM